MPTKILVAYATRAGSTREVAEDIAQTLRAEGLEVDVRPARDVRSLEGVQAIVLGGPLYMFHLLADVHRFLARHQVALCALPVAIFALGPWNNKEEELQSGRDQLAKELAKYPWLHTMSTTVFVGKFDPTNLRFPYNLIPALKRMPAQDDRNWDDIHAWARELAARLN